MSTPCTLLKHPAILPERELRRKYDQPIQEKIHIITESIIQELKYLIQDTLNRCIYSRPEKITWKTKSEGLYVLIHGIYGHPSVWLYHLAELKKHQPNFDVFVPYVPHAGNCSLEDATKPILERILDYVKHHPLQPICLIGFSNGSRLATRLEVQLREYAKGTAVKVSTIAGVHFGCPLIDILEHHGIAQLLFHPAIREELAFGSQKAREILNSMLKKLPPNTERSYDFYATTEDCIVPSLSSSLPQLGLGEQHHLVHGHGHNSVVRAVCQKQMKLCKDWTTRQHAILRSRL